MSNATANATVSRANASVSVFCQCSPTGSWCRGVANATSQTLSARANVSCPLNYSEFIEGSKQQLADFIGSNYNHNRVLYILTLAICSLFLMVFLICLSPFRRHSRNKFLAIALWAAQTLPYDVIAYNLGLMQSPPYDNLPYAIWVALCLLIHGISDARLYGIHDLQKEKSEIFQDGILLYLAAWSMYLHIPEKELRYLHLPGKEHRDLHPPEKELRGHPYSPERERRMLLLAIALLSILVAVALKFVFTLLQTCLTYLTYPQPFRFFGSRRRVTLVADFMSFEHQLSHEVNPSEMTGYKYLVRGEENLEEIMANKESYFKNSEKISEKTVTVERIWHCEGKLLRGRQDLKDKCLSLALFRLLAMRFMGFPLHREHLSKTWGLVRDGLLSKHNKQEERIFRVIEDELSFLYDYLYTQYPRFFNNGKFFAARTAIYAFLELAQFVAGLCIIVLLSKELGTHNKELYGLCRDQNQTWSGFLDFDCNRVTDRVHFFGACIFVVVYVVLRILQLAAIVFSNWTKVWLICEYVKRPCLQRNRTLESLIGLVCGWIVIPFKPWRRKMNQYFLLSSYNYRPVFCRGQEIRDCKKLNLHVEGAVLDDLKNNGLKLRTISLPYLGFDTRLLWACNLQSTTECILVWHVATSFCAFKYGLTSKEDESACKSFSSWYSAHLPDCCKSEEEDSGHVKQEVAQCLSGYCAYLVAYIPALLPDHAYAVEVVFDQAILDARRVLGKLCEYREVYDKLRKLGKRDEGAPMEPKSSMEFREPVVAMGARLGMLLLSEVGDDEEKLWQVLVNFWTNMVLFLASFNKPMAHLKSLANGGEFITHLWALLTHVGGCRQDSNESVDRAANSQQGGSQFSGDKQSTDEGPKDSNVEDSWDT